jgi:hypothetical protein
VPLNPRVADRVHVHPAPTSRRRQSLIVARYRLGQSAASLLASGRTG